MEDRKKVIIFCEYWGNGGIERVVSYINQNINKNKYLVKIVSVMQNSQIYNDKVESLTKGKLKNPIYRFIKTSRNIKQVTKDAHIVHLNIHSSIGLFYVFLLRKSSAKIIIHAHNSKFDNDIIKIKTIISKIMKKLFCSSKYTYIACSKKAAEFCFDSKTKYTIIENQIVGNGFLYNPKQRSIIRNRYNIKNNEIVIGNIGRFQKQKNHKFLIDIFYEFAKIVPNSKLVLIGQGKEEKDILKQIKARGIQEKVILIDYYSKIEEMYNLFDFYVAPSIYEGYGVTILEAITASLVCFVSDNVALNFNTQKNLIPLSIKDSPSKWANEIRKYMGYDRKVKEGNLDKLFIEKIEDVYKMRYV